MNLIDPASLLPWLMAYIYPAVFLGTLVDATGIPFPGRLLLVAAGATAGAQAGPVIAIIALASLAAALMDHVWYLAGRWGARWLTRTLPRLVHAAPDAQRSPIGRLIGLARANAGLAIIAGRYFSSVRIAVWPVFGTTGVGYARFLGFDALASILWAATWVLTGWFLGDRWRTAANGNLWLALAATLVAAVLLLPIVRRFGRTRRPSPAGRRS
jgi:membrane protein DedA with SNARE-associated domain